MLRRSRAVTTVAICLAGLLAACSGGSPQAERDSRGESPERRAAEGEREEGEREEGEFEARVAPPRPTQRAHGRGPRAIDFSGDVRSIRSKRPAKTLRPEAQVPNATPRGGNAPDPLAPATGGGAGGGTSAPAPAPTASFDGLDFTAWGSGWPPDTTGDVGPNHYIQGVNGSIGIWNKSTRTRLAAFTLDAFFTTAGAQTECSSNNQGDPTVVYDSVSGRWILADFAWSNLAGPYYECMAVSKTADPVAGGWWVYQFPVSATDMNDYPKMAVWGDGIYLTANMFRGGSTFTGAKVWALNRDDLTTGAALRYVSFQLSSSYYSLLAANARASAVPAGTPEYLVSLAGSSLRVWRVSLNWTTPTASTLTGPTTIAITSYTRPNSVNQPAGDKLDALADRLLNRVQYTATGTPSLWLTHTVSSNSKAAMRWYQLNVSTATPSVRQRGTYQPTTGVHRWMGSIAVDKVGNAALAYNVSGTSTYPGIRYAGRADAGERHGRAGQRVQPLGRLLGSRTRPDRRLHLLVHRRVLLHHGQRVAHPHRLVQAPHLRLIVERVFAQANTDGSIVM
ncbi:MAG: hypothetical protein ACKO2C_07725 [Actinomycetes bacterium]